MIWPQAYMLVALKQCFHLSFPFHHGPGEHVPYFEQGKQTKTVNICPPQTSQVFKGGFLDEKSTNDNGPFLWTSSDATPVPISILKCPQKPCIFQKAFSFDQASVIFRRNFPQRLQRNHRVAGVPSPDEQCVVDKTALGQYSTFNFSSAEYK